MSKNAAQWAANPKFPQTHYVDTRVCTHPNPLTRHAQVTKVRIDAASRRAEVTSTVQIFRTLLDGGATGLFAVGRYLDTVNLQESKPRLLARHVKLDTRDLSMGTHLPI